MRSLAASVAPLLTRSLTASAAISDRGYNSDAEKVSGEAGQEMLHRVVCRPGR